MVDITHHWEADGVVYTAMPRRLEEDFEADLEAHFESSLSWRAVELEPENLLGFV